MWGEGRVGLVELDLSQDVRGLAGQVPVIVPDNGIVDELPRRGHVHPVVGDFGAAAVAVFRGGT